MNTIARFSMATVLVLLGCGADSPTQQVRSDGVERLTASPGVSVSTNPAAGIYPLGIIANGDTRLIIPSNVEPNRALPLMLLLHGANGDEAPLEPFIAAADAYGVALVIPRSRASSWDVARGGFGEDIRLIDRALMEAFQRIRVDRDHIVFAGFSDGASYALSLAIANGDLATHVIAFAPGFMTPVPRFGQPEFYIAHGADDFVTSARNTEENFVPFLRALGYHVVFKTFDGGHQVVPAEVDVAFQWLVSQ